MINENRLIETFINLVRIDSPSREEAEIRRFIVRELNKHKIQAQVDELGNLYAFIEGEGDSILFSGHMDTVEPGRSVKPKRIDGLIKSDGSTILGADNKANISAILEVIRIVKKNNLSHRPIEIVFSIQEEPGLIGIKRFDFSKVKSKYGICFDKADKVGVIVAKAPYCVNIDGKIIGKAAHSGSEPENGINALKVFINAVSKLNLGRNGNQTTTNIGLFSGGHVRNAVPEIIEFKAEIRSHSYEKLLRELHKWNRIFKNESIKHKARYNQKQDFAYKGYQINKNSKIIKLLKNAYSELKIPISYVTSGGASDANIFREHGIDVVDLGYGAKNPHTLRESIKVKDMLTTAKTMLTLVTN